MANERGLKVDVKTFKKLMEEQKERSRTSGKDTGYAGFKILGRIIHAPETVFLGYSFFEAMHRWFGLIDGYAVLG